MIGKKTFIMECISTDDHEIRAGTPRDGDVPVIAAHCVYATDEDIAIMAKKRVSIALNPKSNIKPGNGFAPAQKSKKALDEGYLPVIYTNADYKLSNECFKKVGYELKGMLCTVGRPEQ